LLPKHTDAKNVILDFIRLRVTLKYGKISFNLGSWILVISESEFELICLIAKCCVTWVGNDNPWLAPVTSNDLKLLVWTKIGPIYIYVKYQ